MPRPLEIERSLEISHRVVPEIKIDLEPKEEVLGNISEFTAAKRTAREPRVYMLH